MSQLYVRGDQDGEFYREFAPLEKKLSQYTQPASWNPNPLDIKTAKNHALPNSSIMKSLTLACNRTSIISPLEQILHNASLKYEAKAYLHWYHKYGVENALFEQSFENIQTIIDNYNSWL
jgi:hypothetical protein